MKILKWRDVGGLSLLLLGVGVLAPTKTSAQTLTTLYSFANNPDGAGPFANLIADAEGNFYGTTFGGGSGNGYGTVFKLTPTGTEILLHRFSGEDGAGPAAALIADAAGNLYGTTKYGGFNYGTVFKLTRNPDGTYTHRVLHKFTGFPTDGAAPDGLITDAAGNLYGTTTGGGANACISDLGCGTVFKLAANPDGTYTETVLHHFAGGNDGESPFSGLIASGAGSLYGTTYYGGGNGCYGYGCGTVFELTPNSDGTYTVSALHRFSGGSDGQHPYAGLLADADGHLFGTTSEGGDDRACLNGCGTVFKLTPSADGTYTESVLHSFAGGAYGQFPIAGLMADAAGNLYGTTYEGGGTSCSGWCGTVFTLSPTGILRVLHSFNGGDGSQPTAGLIADAGGNLYGTTRQGGSYGYGTVFTMTVSAMFTGVSGTTNCTSQSLSFLSRQFGGIAHAATELGFGSVADLQNALAAYCSGR